MATNLRLNNLTENHQRIINVKRGEMLIKGVDMTKEATIYAIIEDYDKTAAFCNYLLDKYAPASGHKVTHADWENFLVNNP